jgi:hypothetical protein
VRLDDLDRRPPTAPLDPADGHEQVDLLTAEAGQRRLEVGALGAARGIVPDDFVDGWRDLGDSVHQTYSWRR